VIVGRRAWMVAAVALGGALGTVARYELALAEPVQSGHFPWATFTANLVGSLVLGVAVVLFAETRESSGVPRAFVAVGFCGGLTTFSTWMVESVLLTRDGNGGIAALYLVVSLALGVVAVALGVGATRRVVGRPVPAFDPERDD
jgi:CrcB protein